MLVGALIIFGATMVAPRPASAQPRQIDACGRFTTTVDFEAAGVPVGQGIAVARNGGPSRSPVCVAVNGGPTFWAYCINDDRDPCAPADRAQPPTALRFTRDRAASGVATDPRYDYPWRADQLTLARIRWVIDNGDQSSSVGRFAIAQGVWLLTGQRQNDPGGLGLRARQALTAVAAQPMLRVVRLTPATLPIGSVHVFQVTTTQRAVSFAQRVGITPFLCDATGRSAPVPGVSVTAAGITDDDPTVAAKVYDVCFLGTRPGSVQVEASTPNPLLELDIWYPTNRNCQGFFDALRSVPQPLADVANASFSSGGGGSPPVTLPATGTSTPAPFGLAMVLVAMGAVVALVARLGRRRTSPAAD